MTDSGLHQFGIYVEAEITEASARSSSLEQRAVALSATNLSVVTLFFVVQTALAGSSIQLTDLEKLLFWIGALASVVSLFFAGMLLVPRKSLVPRNILKMESEAINMTAEKVLDQIVGVRVTQLQEIWDSNSKRAYALLFGTISLGLVAACLSVGLLSHLLAP